MSNTKFTPGPWRTGESENICITDVIIGDKTWDVGSVFDARLISMAPDLVKALERLLSSIPITVKSEALDYDISVARAVLRAAKGGE